MDPRDLIESTLASGEAFVHPPVRPEQAESSPGTASEPVEAPSETAAPAPEVTSTSTDNDKWKQEYEAQVEAWRAQSAEAREKSEKERARWEAIRAEEAAARKAAGIVDAHTEIPTGLPDIYGRPVASTSTSSPVHVAASTAVDTEPESGEGSQNWVDVQASTSSFPSTLPEPSTPARRQLTSESKPAPPSSTLAIFDTSLSTKTRVIALFSALAINFALPFVNGVMLGFGEIFAKNVVLGWFGWKPVAPGYVAGATGLRSVQDRPSPFRRP